MKVNQDPAWQASLNALAKRHKDGDIITHDEIDAVFGLAEPRPEEFQTNISAYREALKQYQFKRFSLVEQMKNDMLELNKVYLDSVFGQGYRVVPPREQTETAYRKHTRNIHQEFEDGKQVMANVRQTALNADEKAKASDLQAKFALLESLFESNRK